jgi:hypothetical protein
MAAATITNRRQNDVQGRMRVVQADSIVFANSGDTWIVPGIKRIATIDLTPTTAANYGFTVGALSSGLGNILTFVGTGPMTFAGGVTGL